MGVHRTKEPVVTVPRTQTVDSETTEKMIVKSQRKGSIGISECKIETDRERIFFLFFLVEECAPNGKYISLVNYSTSQDIDISRWMLTRHIDSETKILYTIPDRVRLKRDSELRIYTKTGGGTTAESSSSYKKLVNNDLVSWGM